MLVATLTPLAAVLAAFMLAAGFAPMGLFLPLALCACNILRQAKKISLHGPTTGRLALIVVNAAMAALIIVWMAGR